MNSVAFCTCNDRKCPFNPVNHDKGCTPCIAKNLHEHEIPTCLFNAISPDRLEADKDEWSWQAFARHVEAYLGSNSPRIPAGEETPQGLQRSVAASGTNNQSLRRPKAKRRHLILG